MRKIYANERTDDVIHPTQFYIKYRPYIQHRSLKLGSIIVLHATHQYGYKKLWSQLATQSFSVPSNPISIMKGFSAWKTFNNQGHDFDLTN